MTEGRPDSIPFGDRRMEVPETPFRLDAIRPALTPSSPMSLGAIAAAIERPNSGPALDEIFRRSRKVLVIVSDATRATGASEFLPPLLDRIRASGRATVTFIVASGIHRRPTGADVEAILGRELAARHEVLLHDPDDDSRLRDAGRTRAGTPVRINASVGEFDTLVATGSASFHYFAGFGGGRKALVPGLAARETISRNHLRALRRDGSRHPGARAGRLDGNPVHRDMVEGASHHAPNLVVNSVLNDKRRIEALFVGHWRRAHEAACRYLRGRRTARVVPRPLLVVSAGGSPKDINLIQAHKSMEAGARALSPGGVYVVVASCREGTGSLDFDDGIARGNEEAMIRALHEDFKVYSQTALAWHRKTRSHRVILVSDLDAEVVRGLGAEPASDVEQALRMAADTLPRDAAGWVLPHGAAVHVETEPGSGSS
jgi:nickel-dependent lactate racemase